MALPVPLSAAKKIPLAWIARGLGFLPLIRSFFLPCQLH